MATVQPHFLTYRAALGDGALHPGGPRATGWLLDVLDLHDGQRVLEVGCGTATTLARVLLAHAVVVDGVEQLQEMVRAARARLRLAGLAGRARVIRGDGAALPLAAARYERAYCESVLGYQDAAAAAAILAEVHRVLRSGGRFVANEAVWREGVAAATVAATNARALAHFGLRPATEWAWGVDGWTSLMRQAGFTVLAADPLPPGRRGKEAFRPRLALTEAYTFLRRARAGLSPRLWAARRVYHRLLAAHREDDNLLEARVFVLEKPTVGS
jgi:SAM-dependent methyltransferase